MPMETIKKLEEKQKEIANVLPETMKNFKDFHDSVLKEGALTEKEKVLIGLGIAISQQCTYCITKWVKIAIDLGVNLNEFMETCGVSMLMNGGPGLAYSTFALETYNKLNEKIEK